MPLGIDPAVIGEKLTGPLSVRIRALLALCMVLGLGAVGTLALWSNSASATSGDFTTGVVDLRILGVKTYLFMGSPGFAVTSMLPGESIAATLKVQNTLSSLPISYTVSANTAAGGPALANNLRLTVFGSALPTNGTSGGLATGSCGGSQLGTSLLSATSSVPVITAPQPLGAAAGSAQSPSTQDLCIVVALAPSAPISVQGQTVGAITMNFSATST